MGVDHLLADDKLPDVPIVRIMEARQEARGPEEHEKTRHWSGAPPAKTTSQPASRSPRRSRAPPAPRRPGLSHGGLEPHGQGADRHRDVPRQGRLREVLGAHRHPGRRAAAHARHARHPRCGGLRPAAQGCLFHQHGARRPCRRRRVAGGARIRPSRRRGARRLQPGAVARRPPLLDASQGPGDAAHCRRHQPAHGVAGDHREHQASAQRAGVDQHGESKEARQEARGPEEHEKTRHWSGAPPAKTTSQPASRSPRRSRAPPAPRRPPASPAGCRCSRPSCRNAPTGRRRPRTP